VIGKKQGSLEIIEDWGDEAVICDPWANETLVVKDQLALHELEQSEIFKLIYSKLKKETLCFHYTDTVGRGHSQRWRNKDRDDLKNKLHDFTSGSQLTFFKSEEMPTHAEKNEQRRLDM
jgi:hypothetical protein